MDEATKDGSRKGQATPNSKPSSTTDSNGVIYLSEPKRIKVPKMVKDHVGFGTTGVIGLLNDQEVLKYPLPRGGNPQVLRREKEVYDALGHHERIVKHLRTLDEGIVLEYHKNGSLRSYAKKSPPTLEVRMKWALQAAEAIQFIHSKGVLQSDIGCYNFLVDSNLDLKLCDFGGSSLNGSEAFVWPETRSALPHPQADVPTIADELFALGSTLYEITTGSRPYDDLDDFIVMTLYEAKKFPDLEGVMLGSVIEKCWKSEYESADGVVEDIRRLVEDFKKEGT